ILIVDPDSATLQVLEELVRSAGYPVTVSQSQAEGFRLVRDLGVDLLLLSADLNDIQCCDALAEVKGSSATSGTRVILLTNGTGAERARGLELGADEVLSFPWEPVELLARIRVQLRQKRDLDEMREKTRIADEGREVAQTAFQALAVTEKMTRDAFSLERALKIGVSVLFAIAILIAGIFLLYSRRADKEARRAYGVIAQLERSTHRQEQLVADARSARADLQQSDVLRQKQQLQHQSEELRQKISGAEGEEVSALRKQLQETNNRLQRIETESQTAEDVIRAYAPSVCLLHVSVVFLDHSSRRPLRYAGITGNGEPLKDSDGNPVYTLEGRAPEVRADFFGTGFIVGDGMILTNHHVVQPWWKNDELGSVLSQGLDPGIGEMIAYFPDSSAGVSVSIAQISEEADLAVVKGDLAALKRPTLKTDTRKEAAVSGEPLISLGYATGINAMLARAGEEAVDEIAKTTGGDADRVVNELVRRKLIRPLVTQGHIGDVSADKIVYDAQTTSGSSGGPLINKDGEVIGVTFAVVRGFGGSNFGVPIRYAQPLLKR
ncbi:MAG: trypsin-like peptidase domain-containing protein, partial [Acidobacteria bacterium Pan2503]|nr:trypsin-like peptidase domain-containing protein [Candidatus Acidoferrum panamensis]